MNDGAGDGQAAEIGRGEDVGSWERPGEPGRGEAGHGPAESVDEAAQDGPCLRGVRCLGQHDVVHAGLERIPVAARPGGIVKSEKAPGAADVVDEAAQPGEMSDEEQLRRGPLGDLDHAGIVIDQDGTPIGAARDSLDGRCRPCRQVAQGGREVDRLVVGQPEGQPAVGLEAVGDPSPGP